MNLASPELRLMVRLNTARLNFSKHKISPRQIPFILVCGLHPNCVLKTFTKYTGYQKHNTAYAIRCMIKSGVIVKTEQKRYILSEKGQKAFDFALPIIKEVTDEYKKLLLKEMNKPLRDGRLVTTPEEKEYYIRKVTELKTQKFSERSIGRQLNISKTTVRYFLYECGHYGQNRTA